MSVRNLLCTKCKRTCKGKNIKIDVRNSYPFEMYYCKIHCYDDGKPMTNADRIRSMSDEELANTLDGTNGDFRSKSCRCQTENGNCLVGNPFDADIEDCRKCLLEWLQQESEETKNV